MSETNAAEAVTDTGIPADMVEDAGGDAARGDVTGLATRLGWVPKEKYRGPEDKWLEAGDFVAKVEKEAPVLRERLRHQDAEIKKRDSQINDFRSKFDEQGALIKELLETSRAAETRGYTRAREDIETRRKEAVANADVEAFQAAERDLADLEKTRAPKKPDASNDATPTRTNGTQQPVQVSPAVSEWVKENSWFESDFELNGVAIGLNAKLIKEKPGLSEKERLDEVTRRVKERYPEMFENKARNAAAAVGTSSVPANNGSRNAKKKTVADLPEDAKVALARFKRLIPKYTDEQFLKDYKWDEKS
jgi:hypothetical protein